MSIVEIAKLAGVSHTTVARVINNEDNVRPDTAMKIKTIMKQVGYTPKPPEKRRGPRRTSIAGVKKGNIIFLAAHEEGFRVISASPVMNGVLHGIEESISFHGMNLIQGVIALNRELPPILSQGKVNGIIVWPDLNGASFEVLESLKKFNLVYLMSGNNYALPGDKVLPNNEQIGKLAATYLVDKGHNDLLFVADAYQFEKKLTMGKRWDSFVSTASHLGANARLLVIEQKIGPFFKESGVDGTIGDKISDVFGNVVKPTGMFVSFDSLTAMLYPLLNKIGVKPGRDIEVLSCNNEKSFLMGLDPMPVSIDIQPELIGKRAVEQLIWRAGHPDDESQITIEIAPEMSL